MKKNTKCYIYARVSTAIQVDGYSLDAQKDKLRKYAEFQNIKFQFPVPIIKEGKEVAQIKGISLDKEKSDEHMVSLEKLSTLETFVLFSKGMPSLSVIRAPY